MAEKSLTQKQAEKKGWMFVHAVEASEVALGDDLYRRTPGAYRAEKYVDQKLINEYGETEEQLLSRISDYEEHLEARGIEQGPVEESDEQKLAREVEYERMGVTSEDAKKAKAAEKKAAAEADEE